MNTDRTADRFLPLANSDERFKDELAAYGAKKRKRSAR
jgi:hypothetical protein